MKYKKGLIFICLIICLFTIASVCAGDVNETVLANDNQVDELIEIENQDDGNADDAIVDVDKANDEILAKAVADDAAQDVLSADEINDESIVEMQDSEVLSEKQNVSLKVFMNPVLFAYESASICIFYKLTPNEGNLTLYFDDHKIVDNDSDGECFNFGMPFDFNLTYGIHNWRVQYNGTEKYNPLNVSGTFEYSYVDFDFPKYVTSTEYDTLGVVLPDDAEGDLTLYIDGIKSDKISLKDTYPYELRIKGFSTVYGMHNYSLVYSGDNKYAKYSRNGTFEYTFMDIVLKTDVIYGENSELSIFLPDDVTGKVEIFFDGNSVKNDTARDYIYYTFSKPTPGEHNVTIIYSGDGKYPARNYSKIMTVVPQIKLNTSWLLPFTDPFEVSLVLPNDANGTLVVILNGNLVNESKVTNGKAVIKISPLPFINDDYYLTAYYNGTDYEVPKEKDTLRIIPKVIISDDQKSASFELPANATGTLKMLLNGKDLGAVFKNGKAKVDLSKNAKTGYNVLQVIYENGNYPSFDEDYDFYMEPPEAKVKVNIPKLIVVGVSTNIVFTTVPSGLNGRIVLMCYLGGYCEEFSGKVINGKATVSVKFKKAGTYDVYCDFYPADSSYTSPTTSFDIVVNPKGKITAKSLTMSYSDKSVYKVRVLDYAGKSVGAGKAVVFKINGKKVATAKTNKKGYASFKPNKLPGTYKITATSLGVKVTKTLKVKHIITLKTVKVKKSAKKLVLKATLGKVKGKYLKRKTVTFKFKGKKYKTKTNKKGVAKVTIKKAVLKKLKVGKKVKYQATYLKDTVVKTAKVKK